MVDARDARQLRVLAAAAREFGEARVHDGQLELGRALPERSLSPQVGLRPAFIEEDEDSVGLPECEIQPSRVGRIARIALEYGELRTAPGCAARGQVAALGRAGSGECLNDGIASATRPPCANGEERNAARQPIDFGGERGEELARGCQVEEAIGDRAREGEGQLGVFERDGAEALAGEAEQMAVADGVEVQRGGPSGQHERLAHRAPAEVLEHDLATRIFVYEGRPQSALNDEDERNVGLTLGNDASAPRNVQRLLRRGDVLQYRARHPAKDRPRGEQRDPIGHGQLVCLADHVHAESQTQGPSLRPTPLAAFAETNLMRCAAGSAPGSPPRARPRSRGPPRCPSGRIRASGVQ